MAGLNYSQETLNGIPIPEDGVSFGNISANGITPYIKLRNAIFSGSYGYDTVTITLKGIDSPLFSRPTPSTMAQQSFSFRGRTWRVVDVQEGAKFNIAGKSMFSSWTVTGVDMNTPVTKV